MDSRSPAAPDHDGAPRPTRQQISRWRRYLADEIAEARVYRDLARHRDGEEREILEGLADAELRHQAHWRELLGSHADPEPKPPWRVTVYAVLAKALGPLVTLVLLQRAEARSPYDADDDASDRMAADEKIHGEVVRGLAARGRARLAGSFRAAVFGANDGLVSNLALVMGMAGTGVENRIVLATGISGLLAGALSMGAGEYVSVSSQRELLEASIADPGAYQRVPHLDLDENELELVFRARGMAPAEAAGAANDALAGRRTGVTGSIQAIEHEEIGSAWGAAISSFFFFAGGAIIPVIPYLMGLSGLTAVIVALVLVGLSLLATGGGVGLLSGAAPWKRALRQLAIGFGAAIVTYLLGLAFGTTIG